MTYKAEEYGYLSQIILSGRRINDGMGKYVAENTVKLMIKANKQIKGAKIAIFGITFKENCPDVRNTKVIDVINELKEYGVNVLVHDPQANKEEVFRQYSIDLKGIEDIHSVDAVIVAVPHDEYKDLSLDEINGIYNGKYSFMNEVAASLDEDIVGKNVLIDIKGMFNRDEATDKNYLYWRL